MAIPNARPTEYKGIVFRSKSEAMFARFLELHTEQLIQCRSKFIKRNVIGGGDGFIYEPTGFEVNGWGPDFLFWFVWPYDMHEAQIPHIDYEVIEYKPARPTETYINEFMARCTVLTERFSRCEEFRYRCSYKIYWGSVFSQDRGTAEYFAANETFNCKAFISIEQTDWLAPHEDAIRATRFDLEAQ